MCCGCAAAAAAVASRTPEAGQARQDKETRPAWRTGLRAHVSALLQPRVRRGQLLYEHRLGHRHGSLREHVDVSDADTLPCARRRRNYAQHVCVAISQAPHPIKYPHTCINDVMVKCSTLCATIACRCQCAGAPVSSSAAPLYTLRQRLSHTRTSAGNCRPNGLAATPCHL
jgi:hypothetical protein